MMLRITYIFSLVLILVSNSFAFTANEIDISQFAIDLGFVVGMVLTILLLLLGYRKTFKVLGK